MVQHQSILPNSANFPDSGLQFNRRTGTRVASNIACSISAHDGCHKGIIVEVTAFGYDIITQTFAPLEIEARIVVLDGPLKGLGGKIRWAANPRHGVELDAQHHNSTTLLDLIGTLSNLP